MCECRKCRCEHEHGGRDDRTDDAGLFPAPGRVTAGGTTDFPAGRPGLPARPEGDRDDTNFNPDGSRRGQDERRPDYDVRLVCRTYVGDVGARPIGGLVFWESPDIWIEGAAGDPDVATPGVVNRVMVHVWNLGLADSWGTHVDLYWCDPSIGINPAVAHAIGSTTLPLAAGQHEIVAFDWIPTRVNDGHSCLVAQVYNPVSDPVVAPFNPLHDRKVAQRNISVLPAAAGETLNFSVFTQNFALRPARIRIEVERVERGALETVAMALGTQPWRSAGAPAPVLLPPTSVRQAPPALDDPLVSGVFRETLQGVPGPSQTKRVGGALRALAAPRGQTPRGDANARGDARPRADGMAPDEAPTRDRESREQEQEHDQPGGGRHLDVPARQGLAGRQVPRGPRRPQQPGGPAGSPTPEDTPQRGDAARGIAWEADGSLCGTLRMQPGQRVQLALQMEVPEHARRGSASVYRIIERTGGEITGGVTVVVRTT